MKEKFPLKCCPWCGRTGKFFMNTNQNIHNNWLAIIKCENLECPVKPKTKEISIRRNQRYSSTWVRMKVKKIVDLWNSGNMNFINEGFELDFEEIISDFKNGKIGLPGYRQDNSIPKPE